MLKRCVATGLLLALASATMIVVTAASAYVYTKPTGQDCGKAVVVGGFGGPRPSNVPVTSTPQIDTFIHHGSISCTKAKKVMDSFEESFARPGSDGKGISPAGWKCAFSAKLKGQACTNSKHVLISDGIVYVPAR